MRYFTDEKGWRLSEEDGEYHSPYAEVDGVWVERSDIVWAIQAEPEVDPDAPAPTSMQDLHDQMVDASSDLSDYSVGLLDIHIVQQPHINEPTGTVCVHVEASYNGSPIDVFDGQFQFLGMPLESDGLETMRRELAAAILRYNGIEV